MAGLGLTGTSLDSSDACVFRIGLTGGIGSGKSTVAAWVAQESGALVIDTDLIARQLTQPGGAAIAALTQAFGEDILDSQGAMDRQKMRDLAFRDATVKARLEAILHPMVRLNAEQQAQAHPARWLVFDIPLLVESGHWRARFDRILVVDCEEATQIQRVMQRSGWDEPTVRAAISKQATRAQRLACADAVIYNEGIGIEALSHNVKNLVSFWQGPIREH